MFRVLGVVCISGPNGTISFNSARERAIFSILAANANHVVSTEKIVDVVWEEDPPSTARGQIHICISNLRRTLKSVGLDERVKTRSPGYLLSAGPGEVDLLAFEDRLTDALALLKSEPTSVEAAGRVRAVATSWEGIAFVDVGSRSIRSVAEHVEERRLAALEECIAAEIALGRHDEVLDELASLVAKHPLRSRLQVLYLTALHRLGRRTDALLAYQYARREMLDSLGVEPDAELRRVRSAILAEEQPTPGSNGARPRRARAPGARLLPPDIADFTGREIETEILRELVSSQPVEPGTFRPVIVSGAGGVGKTSLVRHVAHQVADVFPDGQLYAELHDSGFAAPAVNDILGRFLVAIGVPRGDLPEGIDERSELYRSLLVDRRILIVLDNVADEKTVYPLMPGTKRCAMLITSRSRLTGLAGGARFELEVPEPSTAVRMLENIVDDDRVAAEPATALELVEHCHRLPLAIRAIGARLTARPGCTLGELNDRVLPDDTRLDELAYGGHDVRGCVTAGWESLSERSGRLLMLLALGADDAFPSWLPLPLLGTHSAHVPDELGELVDAGLLELDKHRCRFAPLVRLAARERLAERVPAQAAMAALRRVLSAWLFLVDEALQPEFGSDRCPAARSAPRWPLPASYTDAVLASPLSWLATHRGDLLSALQTAEQAGLQAHRCDLAVRAGVLFAATGSPGDWQTCVDHAMTAASRSHDRYGEAEALHSKGALAATLHNLSEAHAALGAARRIFQEIGPPHSLALAALDLAEVDEMRGDVEAAEAGYHHALDALRSIGDLTGVARALCATGQLRLERGQTRAALEHAEEALALAETARNRRVEVLAETLLGEAHLAAGDAILAERRLRRALDIAWTVDGRDVVARALRGIGAVQAHRQHCSAAERTFTQALAMARRSDDRMLIGRLLLDLGSLCQVMGEHDRAAAFNTQALGVFRDLRATGWTRIAREQCDHAALQRRSALCFSR